MTGSSSFYAVLSSDGRWRTTRGTADLGAACMKRVTRQPVNKEKEEVPRRLLASGDKEETKEEVQYKPRSEFYLY